MIKRARADGMIAAMIAEAGAINTDPNMMHSVARLSVFGSYLSDKPVLGDLDIAYRLEARWNRGSDADYKAWQTRFFAAYPPPDYIRRDFMQRLFWSERFILRRLRVGRGISFHDHGELEHLGCERRELFCFEPESARQ